MFCDSTVRSRSRSPKLRAGSATASLGRRFSIEILGAFALAVIAILALAGGASAQGPVPLLTDSAPFTIATGSFTPALISNFAGDTAVVWESESGLAGRIWNADGSVRADGLEVASTSPVFLLSPSVALTEGGDLVVGWLRFFSANFPAVKELFYQRFDPQGQPAGDPVLAFPFLGWGLSGVTDVAFGSGGEVVALGDTFGGSEYGVVRRRFDAQDEPVGNPLLIGAGEEDRLPYAVRKAVAPTGEFLVVWGSFLDDTAGWGAPRVRGLFFDAQGEPQGEAFEIASPAAGFGVAWHPSGGFLVAWNQPPEPFIANFAPSPFNVRARLVSSSGLGPEVIIKEEVDGRLDYSLFEAWRLGVAVDSDGNGLIVWAQQQASGTGPEVIFGQRVSSDLLLEGPRFFTLPKEGVSQLRPLVTATAPGRFFLVWTDFRGSEAPSEVKGLRLRFRDSAPAAPGFGLGSSISVLEGSGNGLNGN